MKQLSFITLTYRRQQDEKVIKSLKTALHKSLPNNIETKVVYTGTKMDSNFKLKTKHRSTVCYANCPECHEDYIGEIGDFINQIVTIVGRKTNLTCTTFHSK